MSRTLGVLVVLALIGALLVAGPESGSASVTFTVDSTLDTGDVSPGDGACDDGSGNCTVRAAIEETNALAGADRVEIPAGTYEAVTRLAVTDDLEIAGAGPELTTLHQAGRDQTVEAFNAITLSVSDMTFTNDGGGDCLFVDDEGAGTTLDVTNVVFDRCGDAGILTSTDDPDVGGPVYVTVSDSEFIGGNGASCSDPLGGCYGVLIDSNGGSFTMTNSTVTDTRYWGLLLAFNAGDATVEITDSSISGNYDDAVDVNLADGYSADVTIGTTTIDDNGGFGYLASRGVTTTIRDSSISGNGIFGADSQGSLTIERSRFEGNASSGLQWFRGERLEISDSTFAGNDVGLGVYGGATSSASVVNTTVGGNYIGVEVQGALVEIVNSTIAGNAGYGLGPYADTVTVVNSIVAGNGTAGDGTTDCDVGTAGFTSLGHNIDGDGTCGFGAAGDQSGVDPVLGPLSDNGGPVPTQALLSGSPAIDAGDPAACPAADARGIPRPADGNGDGTAVCDIGAFEIPGSVGTPSVIAGWEFDPPAGRLPSPSGSIEIEAISGTGLTSWAEVDVESWYPGGDTSQPLLGAPAPATITVPLPEAGAGGVYRALLPLDGIAEVVSITAFADNGAATGEGSTTDGLPAAVGGGIEVTTGFAIPSWILEGALLGVGSDTAGAGDAFPPTGTGPFATRGLPAASDYRVALFDRSRQTMLDDGPYTVRSGLVTTVDLVDTPFVSIPFEVEVVDFNGSPIAGAEVTVVDGTSGDEVVRATTPADGLAAGVANGTDITVVVDPLDLPYSAASVPVTLTAYDQEIQVSLGATLPTSTVSGVVRRQGTLSPVPGIDVTLTTEIGGRDFTTTTATASDGTYSAEVFQGEVTVAAVNPYAGNDTQTVTVTGPAAVDLLLDGPLPGSLNLEVLTRYAGEATSTSVDVEWRAAVHLRLTARSAGAEFRVGANPLEIPVVVGEPVEVCADGVEFGLPAQCVEALPDPSTFAVDATLELIQAGRVEGSLRMADGARPADWSTAIHEVAADGTRTFVRRQAGPGSFLDVGLIDPGRYQVDVSGRLAGRTDTTTIDVTVGVGDVLDLGTVRLSPESGAFAGRPGSSVTTSPAAAAPGDPVTVRVAARNGGSATATGAVLAIQVPAGTSVVPGSVMLDGVPATGTLAGGWFEVAAGDVAPGATRVLQAWLSTPSDGSVPSVSTQGRIVYGGTTEILGAASSAVEAVTLVAPRGTADFTVPVSGRAPASSSVEITADGVVVGVATANDGGSWRTMVTLPETPLPRSWRLEAVADGTLRSEWRRVVYDPAYVEMTGIVLQQDDGGRVAFDPRTGAGQFPYVATQTRDFSVEVEFDDPSRVDTATVFLGRMRADAVYDPFVGAHVATLSPKGFDDLGDLRVAWQAEPEPLDLYPAPTPAPLTEAELRSQLAAPFDTFDIVSTVDEPLHKVVTMSLPDIEDIVAVVETTLTPGSYTPTAQDLAFTEQTGVHIYGVETEQVEDTDEAYEVRATGFIPDTPSTGGPVSGHAAEFVVRYQVAGGGSAGIAGARFNPFGEVANKVVAPAVGLGTTALGGYDVSTGGDPFDALNSAADLANKCSPEAFSRYENRWEGLSEYLFVQTGLGMTLTAAGLFAGPAGLVLALASWGIDKLISNDIANRISQLRADILADPDCQDPDPDPEPDPEPGGDEAAGITWIYDPSGFVYEVFEDDRIEGVTATVQTAAAPGGPWTVWDAEWFLQENPQITDAEGRYGWDVPEGWWRVRFDKDGYATAYSDVLQVLPPHFDVNVAMTSLSPPEVASVTAFAGSPFVDLVFENWVKAGWMNDFNVAVTDAGGDPVAAAITPIGGRSPADLAKTFRFDLGVPLADGETYTITIDRSVPSYAGIPNESDLVVPTDVVLSCGGLAVTDVVTPGVPFRGTAAAEVILGTPGPDEISGLGGDDVICGLGGDDLLLGGPGDDVLLGGDGKDRLRGAAGDDDLQGGPGSDRLIPGIGNGRADGGPGSDIVDYLGGTGPIDANLSTGTLVYRPSSGDVWNVSLVLIEKADGSRYDDTLIGDNRRNVLRGKQGNDVIRGLDGDDDLIGGTGDDFLRAGGGNDIVKGQANDDTLYGDGGADTMRGGNGNDAVYGGPGNDLVIGGLKVHEGLFSNVIDGGGGTDVCRWPHDGPRNCES